MNNLSMKNAAIVNLSMKYAVVVLQLMITAVLARLLTPEEYGVVAIITVFTSFFSILADLGVGNAIVQNQTITREDVQNIFVWSLKKALLLGLCFALLAVPIAWFYASSVYLKLVPLLGISVVFSAANMVPNALLLKRKQFVLIGLRGIVVCILCAIITITLAYFGAGYYALVVNTIANSLFVLLWNLKGSKLSFVKQAGNPKESIAKIKQFSSYLLKFNIMNYFSRNLDNLLIGKFFGEVELGYYNKAYQLMLYPLNNFTNIITPVLLPFLSERQADKAYIYQKYKQTVRVLSLIGVYIAAFSFAASYELVYILYGEAWLFSVPCFQFLSVSIWSQMICATSGSMFQVLDQTKMQYIRGFFTAGTTVACIFIGVLCGTIEYVSFFVMLAYLSNFATMCYFLVHKAFEERVGAFLKTFLPDVFILLALLASFYVIAQVQIERVFFSFAIKLFGSGVVYLAALFLTKQYKQLLVFLPKRFRNKLIK